MTYAWFRIELSYYGGMSPLNEADIKEALEKKILENYGEEGAKELETEIDVRRK